MFDVLWGLLVIGTGSTMGAILYCVLFGLMGAVFGGICLYEFFKDITR